MIERIVRLSLQQRLLVVIIAVVLMVAGLLATKRLSVDAFPDVTNVQVQVAAEAPGKSPEEVERFVTIPIELGYDWSPWFSGDALIKSQWHFYHHSGFY